MNEKHFQDVKQFIEATVSATVSQSERRMMARMDKMDQRFDDVIDGVNQQVDRVIVHIDQTSASSNASIDDHEERTTSLERRAA